jgi:hypothetical protein
MPSDSVIEVRIGAPHNVLEVDVGPVAVDVPRSVGYFGGLIVAVGVGLIEPPLALFSAAVPLFNVLANGALLPVVRFVGEPLEGAAQPVGSDAEGEGVVQLKDRRRSRTNVVKVAPKIPRTVASKHG